MPGVNWFEYVRAIVHGALDMTERYESSDTLAFGETRDRNPIPRGLSKPELLALIQDEDEFTVDKILLQRGYTPMNDKDYIEVRNLLENLRTYHHRRVAFENKAQDLFACLDIELIEKTVNKFRLFHKILSDPTLSTADRGLILSTAIIKTFPIEHKELEDLFDEHSPYNEPKSRLMHYTKFSDHYAHDLHVESRYNELIASIHELCTERVLDMTRTLKLTTLIRMKDPTKFPCFKELWSTKHKQNEIYKWAFGIALNRSFAEYYYETPEHELPRIDYGDLRTNMDKDYEDYEPPVINWYDFYLDDEYLSMTLIKKFCPKFYLSDCTPELACEVVFDTNRTAYEQYPCSTEIIEMRSGYCILDYLRKYRLRLPYDPYVPDKNDQNFLNLITGLGTEYNSDYANIINRISGYMMLSCRGILHICKLAEDSIGQAPEFSTLIKYCSGFDNLYRSVLYHLLPRAWRLNLGRTNWKSIVDLDNPTLPLSSIGCYTPNEEAIQQHATSDMDPFQKHMVDVIYFNARFDDQYKSKVREKIGWLSTGDTEQRDEYYKSVPFHMRTLIYEIYSN